jgi:RND family efflux transporter MFP subunit
MEPRKDIHDPQGDPDSAAREMAKVRQINPGTGGRLLGTAFALVVALGIGFGFVHFRKTEAETALASTTKDTASEPPIVNVIKVQRAEATQNLSLPGETAAWDASTIYSRVNGYVSKWNVDIGDQVKAGQSLATIDTPDLDAELAAAKAKLNATVAEVGVRDAQADFAKTTEERWKNSPKGVVSDQERDSKSASYAEAVAELAAAKAQVALQQAEVDRLSILTEFKDVKAPFDGVITQRRIDIGDLVTAGSTSATSSLYRLSRDYPMRVFAHAPQSVAAQLIDGGVEAEITSSDDPSLHIVSKVARTAKSLDPASRTMRVEVDVKTPVHGLAPGMYVQVKFKLAAASGFQVPAAALMFRVAGPQVAVVDDSGAISFKDVTIGSDEGSVVSISSGLENGDSQIVAGAKVKAREAPEAVAATTPTTRTK